MFNKGSLLDLVCIVNRAIPSLLAGQGRVGGEDRDKMASVYTFCGGWFIKKIYYQLIKL